jgi:hypothetical protein
MLEKDSQIVGEKSIAQSKGGEEYPTYIIMKEN